MIIYALQSSFTLALLYSCFFALLSRETLHHFNRIMLLTIMMASLGLPLVHITTDEPTAVNQLLNSLTPTLTPRIEEDVQPEQTAEVQDYTANSLMSSALSTRVDVMTVINIIYITGITVMLMFLILRIALLVNLLRGGLWHTDKYGNAVILKSGDMPPFSIFRFIVMSVNDYEQHRNEILTHEQAHIRLGHTYDLLLYEVVKTLQWFNPFIYLLGRDLKAVHEYEADETVINNGIDAKTYQQLLVMKVVGNRLQPFANNLNHSSLKNRIIMMHRTKSHANRALKAALAIPVAAFALYTFAAPRPIVLTNQSTEAPTLQTQNKVYDENEVTRKASFPGGEMKLMKYMIDTMRYPKEAEAAKVQGHIIVEFIVEKDGKISGAKVTTSVHPTLDAEALRVINAMPTWTPAQAKGQTVRQRVKVPITFKL